MVDWKETVKLIRRRLYLKQAALADMIGVDQSAVSRWEAGAGEPNVRAQAALRDLLMRAEMNSSQLAQLKLQVRLSEGLILLDKHARFQEGSNRLGLQFSRAKSDLMGKRNEDILLLGCEAEVVICDTLSKRVGAISATLYNGVFGDNGALQHIVADVIPVHVSPDDAYMLFNVMPITKEAFDSALTHLGRNFVIHYADDLDP